MAVRYEGCELAVLSRCTVKSDHGAYGYSPVTRKQSKLVIKDADELYANMPVGAVRLESKFQQAGQLNVQMTIVGRYESTTTSIFRDDLDGECSEATHVIAALTVGSFTFSAGSDAEISGGASVLGAGGGGKSTALRETIQHDGDDASCARATTGDKSPPEGCGALLQIEVMPLAKGKRPAAPVVFPVLPDASPAFPPADSSVAENTAPLKPIRCRKGERAEDGVCVKLGAKKPATKPALATATPTCMSGQHVFNDRCVDDTPPRSLEPTPAPPTPFVSCLPGSHFDNGGCVVNRAVDPSDDPSVQAGENATERANPWRSTLLYLAIGSGVSAAAFGSAALSSAGKVADGCNAETRTCTSEAADERSKARTFSIVADVSLGVMVLA